MRMHPKHQKDYLDMHFTTTTHYNKQLQSLYITKGTNSKLYVKKNLVLKRILDDNKKVTNFLKAIKLIFKI